MKRKGKWSETSDQIKIHGYRVYKYIICSFMNDLLCLLVL